MVRTGRDGRLGRLGRDGWLDRNVSGRYETNACIQGDWSNLNFMDRRTTPAGTVKRLGAANEWGLRPQIGIPSKKMQSAITDTCSLKNSQYNSHDEQFRKLEILEIHYEMFSGTRDCSGYRGIFPFETSNNSNWSNNLNPTKLHIGESNNPFSNCIRSRKFLYSVINAPFNMNTPFSCIFLPGKWAIQVNGFGCTFFNKRSLYNPVFLHNPTDGIFNLMRLTVQ